MNTLFLEKGRQQIHFSCKKGWLNDPNGLCFINDKWHMFFQHNPDAPTWGPMHWGHAISNDLIHWEELPVAIYPTQNATIYSGGAYFDYNNITGLGTSVNPPLLFYYTLAGKPFVQNLAYSLDEGKTLKQYSENPILSNLYGERERDPSIAFNPETNSWFMVIYKGFSLGEFSLLESEDLVNWKESDVIRFTAEDAAECPELLRMYDIKNRTYKWVLLEASGNYLVGEIDNGKFKCNHESRFMLRPGLHTGYAGQTFKNAPDNRVIFIAWQRDFTRENSFSQSMTLPCELRLENNELKIHPVHEVEKLRKRKLTEDEFLSTPKGINSFEIIFTTSKSNSIVSLGPVDLNIDHKTGTIVCNGHVFDCNIKNKEITWNVFFDTNSVELFNDAGDIFMAMATTRWNTPIFTTFKGEKPYNVKGWALKTILNNSHKKP